MIKRSAIFIFLGAIPNTTRKHGNEMPRWSHLQKIAPALQRDSRHGFT